MSVVWQSAVVDHPTGVLLAAGVSSSASEFVCKCMSDTLCAHYVQIPSPGWFESRGSDRYIRWTWNYKHRIFSRTRPESMTDSLRSRSNLAQAKVDAMTSIVSNLGQIRHKVGIGVLLQETVYAVKRAQAREFKDSGYDETRIGEFPYVVQYADFVKTNMRQAADDILLKAKMGDDSLLKTELLRLRYFNKMRDTQDAGEVAQILRKFYTDCYSTSI